MSMIIATWNVERLKHKAELDAIIRECERPQADILILTETDEQVRPSYRYCFQTPRLDEIQPGYYKATENRVSIFTNYPCVRRHPTYDPYTSICVELETERGNLLVYGTIIGIFGNRHTSFQPDLLEQVADFRRLAAGGASLCVCGDYNCSFSDNYYYTKAGRDALLRSFEENKMKILTEAQPWCIDHIAISGCFVEGCDIRVQEWNLDKALSDHKGIAVEIS